MDAQNRAVNQGRDSEKIKDIHAHSPAVRVAKFLLAFLIKAVNLRNLTTFVVPTQQDDTIGMLSLQEQKERQRLQTVITTIDVIALIKIVKNNRR